MTLSPIRIVGVHGVGNRFGADLSPAETEERRALKAAAWVRHLGSGLGLPSERFDLDFAYYSDKLVTGPVAQGTGSGGGFLDDPLAQEMLDAWARELGVPDEVSQGRAAIPLRVLSAWAARRFDLAEGRLRVFLQMLFPEVATYLAAPDSPLRAAAREEVAARIARHRPRVVIAHSLGSVVSYEALHAYPEPAPDLFLTLGSPLALPKVVFERLAPVPAISDGGGSSPRGLRMPGRTRWVNIADPGDPVAVPPHLSRYFDGIDADHTDSIHLFDFHLASNYLKSRATAGALTPYLEA